jgi:hypothetical protein
MRVMAVRDANERVIIMITCDNEREERIIRAVANSTWIGSAIRDVFGYWECPFYEALREVLDFMTSQSSTETQALRDALNERTR